MLGKAQCAECGAINLTWACGVYHLPPAPLTYYICNVCGADGFEEALREARNTALAGLECIPIEKRTQEHVRLMRELRVTLCPNQ